MISDDIRDLLLSIPSAKLCNGGREIVLRCRYCADSNNINHAHMYINLGYNDTPLYFNCFKCHTSGIITYDKLLSWGVNTSSDSITKLINYNKSVLSLDKNRKFKDRLVYNIINPSVTNNNINCIKLNYINNRLGLNLGYKDLIENKIVLNLFDILNYNNIHTYTRKESLIHELNNFFLGFISQDNAFVNCRNLLKNPNKIYLKERYINYNIFGKFDNTMKFYVLPTSINIYNPNRIKIHIAEGPFDILSIYYNLRKTKDHNIYGAVTGSGYVNMCKHFINTMKLVNIEFHLYPDADINKSKLIKSLTPLCNVFNIPLYLHYNNFVGEKDFGVPLDRIDEYITRVV